MSKRKILVVDDEADFLKIIKLRLEASNYKVITASCGEEGLRRIKEDKPDAVLLDILMPGLDGLEVLKRIREEDKHLPVFMVTAFSSQERFDCSNRLNASGIIVKTGNLKKEIGNIASVLELADRFKLKDKPGSSRKGK